MRSARSRTELLFVAPHLLGGSFVSSDEAGAKSLDGCVADTEVSAVSIAMSETLRDGGGGE